MSLTNWKSHVKVWLCDKDRKPTHRIDKDLERPMLNVAAFGRGHFAFEIDAGSIYASEIDAKSDEEQYIAWQRRDRLVSGVIQRVNKGYTVQDGKIRTKIQVSGKLAGVMAWFPIMQPDSGADDVEFTGKVDDAMKDHVQYQMVVGDAYADPSANARGYAGVSVAADKTKHPDTKTLTRSGACLGDELLKWGVEYDIDWDLETTWAVGGLTWQFQTWYQGRGSDLTIGNGDGNVPVILSDIYEVVGEASCYIDRYGFRTHGYTEDLSGVVVRDGVTGFMRREVVVKATSTDDVTLALQRYDQAVGQTFLFIESDGIWAGREFWVYDKVTHGVKRLSTDYEDDYVAEIEFSYDQKGNETIKLILGDPKPDLSKTPGSRRADTETEEPWHGGFWRRDNADTRLYPAYAGDAVDSGTGGFEYNDAAPDGEVLMGDGTSYKSGTLGGGVTGRISHAAMATTIDSNAVVQPGAPGVTWAGMLWLDDDEISPEGLQFGRSWMGF